MNVKLFITIFVVILINMNDSCLNDKFLKYENFFKPKEISKELDFPKLKLNIDKSYYLSVEEFKNISGFKKISGNTYDLLVEIDIINQWDIYKNSDINPYSNDYDKFIILRKKELEIFYFGSLQISDNFNSHLIIVKDGEFDEYIIHRSLYLLNISENYLISVTKISDYICFEGSCKHLYSENLNDNSFVLKEAILNTDSEFSKETDKIMSDQINVYSNFYYDKKGYLKIIK